MSYSRWSNSSWYVFWNTSSGDDKDSQVLSAWYSLDKTLDWTYEEVEDLFKDGITEAAKFLELKYNCNGDEAAELQEIMQVWMSDVRSEFP
jgi:hypothetical protein